MNQTPPHNRLAVISTEKLIPDPERPRQFFSYTEDQGLVDSIKEFGIMSPLVVAPNSDETYTIIDGYLRHYVALKLDITEVPCMITPPMSSTEVEDLRIELEATFLPLSAKDAAAHEARIRGLQADADPLSHIG